jgi:hypothetical protein
VAIITGSPRRRPHGAAIFVAYFFMETDQLYRHSSLIDPIENILSFSNAAAISNLPSPNGSVAIATVSHSMMQKARLSMLRTPSAIKVRSRKSSTPRRYNGNSPTGPRADNNCPTHGQIKRFKTNHDRIIQKQHGVFTDSQYSEFDLVNRSQFYEYDDIVSIKGSADDSDHLTSTVILDYDQSKNSKSPLYKNITDTTEGLSTQASTESKSLAMDIPNITAPCYYCKTCENCGMKFASKDMKTSTHRYHIHKERCDRQNIGTLKLPDSAFVIIEECGKIYYQCNFNGCLASNEL